MRKFLKIMKIESILYTRDFFGFFFTFAFPILMLILYGSIYGNEPSDFFNGLGAMDASVPAYSAMIIGVTGLMAFPLTIASYKENKVYKRFDATPIGKGVIISAQAVVNFCMTILGFVLLFIVGKLVYNIEISGDLLSISLMLICSIASIFSLGFFFTAVAPTAKISNLLSYVSYFIMIFLSGATMPREMFPKAVKDFSEYLPLTHVVNVLQGTFKGADFSEYGNSLLILVLVMFFCLIIGGWLYLKRSWN